MIASWRLVTVAVTIALVAVWGHAERLAITPLPNDWIKSVVYFAAARNSLNASSGAFTTINDTMSQLPGATHVSLQWMWSQDTANSSTVGFGDETPPVEDLIGIIRYIRSLGLKVVLKPIVVANDGTEMAQLQPANITAWFASYAELLFSTAEIAYQEGVDVLSVGIELQKIATNASNDMGWRGIIAGSRVLCPACRLTYCSNPLLGETQAISLWDALDFVGLDLYIPFILPSAAPNAPMPTMQEMIATFEFIWNLKVGSWYRQYVSQHNATGLKLVVMESGYPSADVGLRHPWLLPDNCSGTANAPNMTAQTAAYTVMLSLLSGSTGMSDNVAGFAQFWMGQPGSHDWIGYRNMTNSTWACGWTLDGKPALAVLAAAYKSTVAQP
jgi:hypothetical protein